MSVLALYLLFFSVVCGSHELVKVASVIYGQWRETAQIQAETVIPDNIPVVTAPNIKGIIVALDSCSCKNYIYFYLSIIDYKKYIYIFWKYCMLHFSL